MVAKIIQMIQFIIENRSNHRQDRLLNVTGYPQKNGTRDQRGGTYPDGCSILDLDVRLLEYGTRHGNGKLNEVLKEISSNIYERVFIILSTAENGYLIETDNIAMLFYLYCTLLLALNPAAVL